MMTQEGARRTMWALNLEMTTILTIPTGNAGPTGQSLIKDLCRLISCDCVNYFSLLSSRPIYSAPYASFNNSTTTIVFPRFSLFEKPAWFSQFPFSFSQALSSGTLNEDSSEDGEEEEERRRRKVEDVDYQVLSPHLNLQDIHAFTESGLKSNVIKISWSSN